jgi:ABC-2 type transport system permease protein
VGTLSYRADFVIGILAMVAQQVATFALLGAVFGAVDEVGGFSFAQMLVFFGLATLGRSIHLVFFDNLWMVGSKYIQKGELDRVLTRPAGVLFQVLVDRVNVQGLGLAAVGLAALILGESGLPTGFSPVKWVLAAPLVVCSGMVFMGLHLVTAGVSFWMVDSAPLQTSVFTLAQFGQFPAGIFPGWVRGLILGIVPYAFTGFAPGLALTTPAGTGAAWALACVGVAAATTVAGSLVWTAGVRRYESVGS